MPRNRARDSTIQSIHGFSSTCEMAKLLQMHEELIIARENWYLVNTTSLYCWLVAPAAAPDLRSTRCFFWVSQSPTNRCHKLKNQGLLISIMQRHLIYSINYAVTRLLQKYKSEKAKPASRLLPRQNRDCTKRTTCFESTFVKGVWSLGERTIAKEE